MWRKLARGVHIRFDLVWNTLLQIQNGRRLVLLLRATAAHLNPRAQSRGRVMVNCKFCTRDRTRDVASLSTCHRQITRFGPRARLSGYMLHVRCDYGTGF